MADYVIRHLFFVFSIMAHSFLNGRKIHTILHNPFVFILFATPRYDNAKATYLVYSGFFLLSQTASLNRVPHYPAHLILRYGCSLGELRYLYNQSIHFCAFCLFINPFYKTRRHVSSNDNTAKHTGYSNSTETSIWLSFFYAATILFEEV